MPTLTTSTLVRFIFTSSMSRNGNYFNFFSFIFTNCFPFYIYFSLLFSLFPALWKIGQNHSTYTRFLTSNQICLFGTPDDLLGYIRFMSGNGEEVNVTPTPSVQPRLLACTNRMFQKKWLWNKLDLFLLLFAIIKEQRLNKRTKYLLCCTQNEKITTKSTTAQQWFGQRIPRARKEKKIDPISFQLSHSSYINQCTDSSNVEGLVDNWILSILKIFSYSYFD